MVHEQCYGSVTRDCSEMAHKDLGMDWTRTQACVASSFTSATGKRIDMESSNSMQDEGVINTVIEAEMKYFDLYGPKLFPAVVINNQTYRGQLEVEAVFNAICAGFYTMPGFCQKYLTTNNINRIDLLLMTGRHSKGKVFVICLIVSIISCIAVCFYRRHAKRQMKAELTQ